MRENNATILWYGGRFEQFGWGKGVVWSAKVNVDVDVAVDVDGGAGVGVGVGRW